ncbi:MAG: phage tail-like protein [Maribacter sp.]|jgi:phage tail-like protein
MAGYGYKQTTGKPEQTTHGWPMVKFQFEVLINQGPTEAPIEIYAQSVEGLEYEVSVVEYRHGEMADHHKVKMPGMKTYGNCTIKKGMFRDDNDFYNWLNATKMNLITRSEIEIRMLDADTQTPLLSWTLHKAFPVKFTPSDLGAEEDSDPAIEELELAFESFEQTNTSG